VCWKCIFHVPITWRAWVTRWQFDPWKMPSSWDWNSSSSSNNNKLMYSHATCHILLIQHSGPITITVFPNRASISTSRFSRFSAFLNYHRDKEQRRNSIIIFQVIWRIRISDYVTSIVELCVKEELGRTKEKVVVT
jgi:hypothetical protein